MGARPHVRGVSDSDDDLPLSSLKKRKVADKELEGADGEHPHLDCCDSSCSEKEQDLIGEEPISPKVPTERIPQRPLTDQFPEGPPLRVDLFNQAVVDADLSARALAYAPIVT